jgi:formate hydrogenlyase transcriptional activator
MGALERDSQCDLRAAVGMCAIRWLTRFVVASIVLLAFPIAGTAAQLPRSVLILDQSGRDSVWFDAFFSAFRSTLNTNSAVQVSVYAEHLDLSRFGGPRYDEGMRIYLRDKFSERPIGVVIAQGSGALEFVLRSRAELWPGVPVIFAAVDEETGKRLSLPPDVTGTLYQRSFRNLVAAARVLVPNLKRIALVGDPFERQAVRGHYKHEVPVFTAEFELIDLMGLPMVELRKRVATLPDDTAIIYTAINIDGAGVAYRPYEGLAAIAEVANRPIVVDVETNMGHGGTGGFVTTPVPVGEAAARLALRILEGEDASKIPVTTGDFTRPVFDWRQLQRFGISESMLPPGSEIRFRSPSVWEQYRWYIIAALTIIAVQAGLIVGLLLQRVRRRRAEAELRESQEFMELSTSAGELGLWVRDMAGSEMWANPRLRSLFGFGQNDVLRFDDVIGRIHPDDRARVIAKVERAQRTGDPFEDEFRVIIPDGSERWVAAKGRTVDEPSHNRTRRMGVVFDVTERKRAEQDLNAALVEIRGLKERLEEENIYLKEEISQVKGFEEIVGNSDVLKYVLTRVEQVAKTDATVLLQGETGVGKELIARAIHEKSSRSEEPYVKVNCATLPEALVESELFGHEKGAFTGADRQRKGRFELADGGTILLDEVGELPAGTQAKLLRVLQEGEFERVGGSSTIKVKVRVIAATNRKLHDDVSAGRFRQDLFYRLNVYPITVPPLRQRREDIPLLVSHYARQIGERLGKTISEVPAQVMREFTEYNWPGNIRELQNVIERAVIVSSDGVLRLPEPLVQTTTTPDGEGGAFKEPMKVSTMNEAEREHILRALETTGWRIEGPKGAAAMLKLHPSTLRFRMKKLGLSKVLSIDHKRRNQTYTSR